MVNIHRVVSAAFRGCTLAAAAVPDWHKLLQGEDNFEPEAEYPRNLTTHRSLERQKVEGTTMLTSIESRRDPFDPALRGYHAVYRENQVNHCPGCGRTHWYLGRLLAECAFCGTALPLQEAYRHGPAPSVVGWRSRPCYQQLDAA